ncbi:anti-sigma regulatory factor (Ser/Thr protein kinase) [Bradyrhizobium sp. YR681]|uniref:ATP-binding SpoIIE family protein phosphatase n=1 Tax=Bradyrhizobium sp. YR681 TaxID=1144344 RepID=UPI000270D81D|nr:ATP-binding SpoIIE family protein phosphatase [Bradyrhizobium sp. YR681]EJN10961.1 anti-sigma regulatory factor (Ser/Thr protein kinase) [Bradyrhizobium sp. YR681]
MKSVGVNDQSGVAEARRAATDLAQRVGFNETDKGKLALVATELSTNLVKHGSGGEILVGVYEDNESQGIEILALDKGAGMSNVAACLEDGYSSAGTAGRGLGAVIRQSHFVEIGSWPGVGTAVLARIAPGTASAITPPTAPTWGGVSVAKAGQDVCGDALSVSDAGNVRTLLVVDGLGHGPEAAEAAVEAVRLFHRYAGHSVPNLIDYIHGGLRSTRGAAVSIARFDPAAKNINFAGIGNVAGVIITAGDTKRMVSMAGTAGFNTRKIRAFDYPFTHGLIVLHSDGLASTWMVDRYPNLAALHPSLIAAILYRDFTRHRDDATVLVAKW